VQTTTFAGIPMAAMQSGATPAALGGFTVMSLCAEQVSLVQRRRGCAASQGTTDMALGGVPGITYNPTNEATIPVVMPLDPLVTVFNWPQTIWRGEMWYKYQTSGDVGFVYFHLVFANGISAMVRKDKKSGETAGWPPSSTFDWDLCSDCVSGGPRKCLKHKTNALHNMFGAVYRPAAQPGLLFKVIVCPVIKQEGQGYCATVLLPPNPNHANHFSIL
jgi:hypothetical protein